MENPWTALTDKPFVLKQDRKLVKRHNERCRAKDGAGIYTLSQEVFPEPLIGSPSAPIWLLNLNPGLHPNDLRHPRHVIQAQKRSASLKAENFWFIDDAYKGTEGHKWWSRKLGFWIERYGRAKVMKSFFCAELFPYHSFRFRWWGEPLPSRQFTLDCVRHACASKKRFVIMRARRDWLELVPELVSTRWTSLKSARSGSLGEGNLLDPTVITELLD